MSLQQYVRQVKSRQEFYTNPVDKIQDFFINEAKFGPTNFPNGVGGDKPQGPPRTVYPPYTGDRQSTSSPDGHYDSKDLRGNPYNFPEGFPTLQDTSLLNKDGEEISKISKGTRVHFVVPASLHKIKGSSWYAKVSLKGYDKSFDGYISIGHVEKPSGKGQKRVVAGTETQEACAVYVKKLCMDKGISFDEEFVTAPSGSTIPDLIMTIDGKKVQFEIKGTNDRKNEITFFDITARKKQNAKSKKGKAELDKTAELYIASVSSLKNVFKKRNNDWNILRRKRDDPGGAFHAVMEYSKSLDPSIGYAGDDKVVKSGKLPSVFKTTDGTLLKKIHVLLLDHFIKGGDDYFAIHDRSNDTFEIYNVNKKNDILQMPTLPQFKEFRLSTYGGPSAAGTRVGYKIKF